MITVSGKFNLDQIRKIADCCPSVEKLTFVLGGTSVNPVRLELAELVCDVWFVLYCIVLYCIVLHCIVLYCIVLYCIVMYGIVLYCIVLHCIVLYCIVLSCIVMYIVLYCIVLYCFVVLYCICIVLYCVIWLDVLFIYTNFLHPIIVDNSVLYETRYCFMHIVPGCKSAPIQFIKCDCNLRRIIFAADVFGILSLSAVMWCGVMWFLFILIIVDNCVLYQTRYCCLCIVPRCKSAPIQFIKCACNLRRIIFSAVWYGMLSLSRCKVKCGAIVRWWFVWCV